MHYKYSFSMNLHSLTMLLFEKKHELYEKYFAQSLIMQIGIITKVHVLTYFSASML